MSRRTGREVAKGLLFGCGGIVIGAALVIALLVAMIWWGCKSMTVSQRDQDTAYEIEKAASALVLPDVHVAAQAHKSYTSLYVEGLRTADERTRFLNGLASEQKSREWTPIWATFRTPHEDGTPPGHDGLFVLTAGEIKGP